MDEDYSLSQPGSSRSQCVLDTEVMQNYPRDQKIPNLSQNHEANISRGQLLGGPSFQHRNNNSIQPSDELLTEIGTTAVQLSNNNTKSNRESLHGKTTGLTLKTSVQKDVKYKMKMMIASLSKRLKSPMEKPDGFVHVMQLIAKICNSPFDQLKLTFLLDVCSSQFINNLRNYLMDLPYQENKSTNNKYWENETEFWKNFITFCECIMIMSPSTALNKCRSLIDGTSKCCLDMLKDKHNYVLTEEYKLKLIQLRETLAAHEQNKLKKEERKLNNELDEEHEPPESFRELSVLPCREDLIEEQPYLRANLIKGSYRDVEHYLDVQFRLLREDCFGPLREGILQFIRDPARKKYDNIRVLHNVNFVKTYVTPQKIGRIIEVDENTKKRFKRINWAHSKRFIFGSLVLLTKDNCNSFIVATILDRDVNLLYRGKIPVSIVDITVEEDLYKNDTYTMIESDVYFEPYFHILNVLKDPNFPQQIAMKKYIIDVNPEPSHPAYLTNETVFKVQQPEDLTEREFTVLDFNTWPSSDELQLNESQYEAYKTALTHEFAIIQGPPGTGKTYLGVRVVKTLLENLDESGCTILLLCYTNHALDQFLEAIIPFTDSIARIGGQSRNKAMDRFNLNNLRKQTKSHPILYKLYSHQRETLRSSILKLQRAQAELDSITDSIISYNCLKKYAPECSAIENCYKNILESRKDPLCYWLFENIEYNFEEPILVNEEDNLEHPNPVSNDDDNDNRHEIIIDDLILNVRVPYGSNFDRAFTLSQAETELSFMTKRYIHLNYGKWKRELHVKIVVLRDRIRIFKQMKGIYQQGFQGSQNNITDDLSLMPMIDRWMLYFRWTKLVQDKLKKAILPLQESKRKANDAYEKTRMIMDYRLLRNCKIVGMTTSGAARLRQLVRGLAPRIVVVEEAAEVLEQHIITSLTTSCQHLILIGDHQQLRPSAASMRLAKHFSLEVSLFERMILNALHSRRLAVQHRMRPSIAALVAPHVYSDLRNHPTVERFPDVRGVAANLFFFSHDWREEIVDDSLSRTNKKEGDMTLRMANYIMQQDYEPEDVTILAAYSGQMFYLRKERSRYAHLSNVKITVVDNYQGEESKIILLSLVRNNNENKIGFLGTENRICVALSRAKEGFYIFGNIDILKRNSTLWTKIAGTLEDHGAVGTSIKLRCENHPNQTTNISSVDDFMKVPEGGCLLKCNCNLPCLHACPLICHGYDRGHDKSVCPVKCERFKSRQRSSLFDQLINELLLSDELVNFK